MFYFSHSKKLLSLTLIICQLFLVSSFLFIPAALAEEEAATPPETTTEAPAEPPTENPASPDTSLDQPINTLPTEDTTADEPLIETPTTTAPVTDTPTSASDEATTTPITPENNTPPSNVLIIGSGGGSTTGSSAPSVSLTMENGGTNVRVLASWAMNTDQDENNNYLGTDDGANPGAEFLPSGQYKVDKPVALCALVSSGTKTVKNVFTELYYPENIAISPATTTAEVGCGQKMDTTLSLKALDQEASLRLFCDQLKNNNNNLVTFDTGLGYDALCSPDGLIQTNQAQVYCEKTNLAYWQPAGNYTLKTYAQDPAGAFSPILENTFKYLELTAFSVDFDTINYGPVQLNTPKIIEGDDLWDAPIGANPPTISNVGNTRLQLVVKQNDFGLGGLPGNWHVNYQAKIGETAAFISYQPETPTTIDKVMDLAETNALDFGITVYKFPTENSSYSGQMTLTANKVEHLTCQ